MLNNNLKTDFHILIIDKSNDYNNALHDGFKDSGYILIQAFDIDTANKYLNEFEDKLSLVILDIEMDGVEPEKLIKNIEKNTTAKIIVLSQKEDTTNREEYFKHGILDYHLKSNPTEHIISDINESIERLEINKKETILVVDDSKIIRFVLKTLLSIRNYNVLIAENATDALKIIEEKDITLLILDLELPDIHGIEVLNKLRNLNFLNNFVTIILSSSTNPSMVRQALKKGASDFLKKPIMFEEFLLKIDLWVQSSRSQKTIKEQKKQIENSLLSFESLVNSTLEALLIFEDNKCVDLNNEAVELIGGSNKQELIGKFIFDIFTDISEHNKSFLLDNNLDHYFEDIITTPKDKTLDIQVKEKNIAIEDKTLKIIAIMDITQIKQKEKLLSHQTKMASMGEMIGNIAHQWRQPLTAISVAAGGIKLNYELDMVDQEEIIMELDNIVNNTQFLSATIEDFQNFLKDNRATTMFTIKDTIEKTLGIIKANIESHDIHIIKDYKKNIQIDAIQNDLIQVFLNIINNAGDALKTIKDVDFKKYIIITINGDDKNVIIQIQDTAGGIPDKIISKIFEPYFTTKHQSKGTGLGLYMTHQIIVDNMNGQIEVDNHTFEYENETFKGARFTIKLPLNA